MVDPGDAVGLRRAPGGMGGVPDRTASDFGAALRGFVDVRRPQSVHMHKNVIDRRMTTPARLDR